ncbi:MAG: hypothetical protein ACLPX5_09545 [Dissulfurispiraceae bacterium]
MGLYRRRDSNHIWACVQHNGKEKRFSTGTDDMRIAQNILAKVKVELIEKRWFDRPKDVSFCDLVAKYMKKYECQRDSYTVKHLVPYFGDMLLSEITPEMVEDYLIDRDESESNPKPATIYQEFSLGRRMFNVARKRWKLVSSNPFADVEFSELLPIDNARERWLTVEEEQKLLIMASPEYLREICRGPALFLSRGQVYSPLFSVLNYKTRPANLSMPFVFRWPSLLSRWGCFSGKRRKTDPYLKSSLIPVIDCRAFEEITFPCLSPYSGKIHRS